VYLRGVDGRLWGDAALADANRAVEIAVVLHGAAPGEHAVHIHEPSACTDLPKTPESVPHFDVLGNIPIGADGNGRLLTAIEHANLRPGVPRSLLGRTLVVHEHRDLGAPSARSVGAPIACGVIQPGPLRRDVP
jgi:Cu-Zn family superoxide dismutase